MTESERTIFETPYWKVILRIDDQTYLGRAVVVCTRSVPSLPELTAAEWTDLKQVITGYEAACKLAFGATMFNWTCLMNEAYQHQPPDPQVHWHVRPRYEKTVNIAGELFTDERYGHHYERKTNRLVPDKVAQKIIDAIRQRLL